MSFLIKEIILGLSSNIILFLVLMMGLQNSTNKSRVNIFKNETVDLPIGFIVGTSFITGSCLGNVLALKLKNKNK